MNNTYLSNSKTCYVTQVFGNKGHLGTDIQFLSIGWSDICFPKNGVVTVSQKGGAGNLWTYGEWYEIKCDDGTKYRLAHLRENTRVRKVGDIVLAGEFAAQQGNTGNVKGNTGIHLHIEYFVNGKRVSPAPLMGFPDKVGAYNLNFMGITDDKNIVGDDMKLRAWAPIDETARTNQLIENYKERGMIKINGKRYLSKPIHASEVTSENISSTIDALEKDGKFYDGVFLQVTEN